MVAKLDRVLPSVIFCTPVVSGCLMRSSYFTSRLIITNSKRYYCPPEEVIIRKGVCFPFSANSCSELHE